MRYIALIHILGHACFRTLQFLRAPTLLHDYRTLENAIGTHLPHLTGPVEGYIPLRFQSWVYRFALEKGYLDAWLNAWFVNPFMAIFRGCDAWERRWTGLLSGNATRNEAKPGNTSEET